MGPEGEPPNRQVELKPHAPADVADLSGYQANWRAKARAAR